MATTPCSRSRLPFRLRLRGLLVGYSPNLLVQPAYFIHPVQMDFTVGTENLHADTIPVSAYSDWTVDLNFGCIPRASVVICHSSMSRLTAVIRWSRFLPPSPSSATRAMHSAFPPDLTRMGCSVHPVGRGRSRAFYLRVSCPPVRTMHPSRGCPITRRSICIADMHFISDRHQRCMVIRSTVNRVATTYTVKTTTMEGDEKGFLQALYPYQYASLVTPGGFEHCIHVHVGAWPHEGA